MKHVIEGFSFVLKTAVVALISLYRYAISPMLGSHCRYHPSCSEYARQAIELHGLLSGGWLAVCRISRCHPLHEGGLDPVPGSSEAPERVNVPQNEHSVLSSAEGNR